MSIKKIALIAFIAAVLDLLAPFWIAARTVAGAVSTHTGWKWWTLPAMALLAVFSAIMPTFYLALYRNQEPLQFSRRLRPVSLAAAVMLGLLTAIGFWTWAANFGLNTSILPEARENWNIERIAPLLTALSNLACTLLLIAFFQHSDGESSDAPSTPSLLSFITKVAVIVWGIVLVFDLVHLVALTPYTYFQIRGYALQMGRRPPELREMLAISLRTLIDQACLFTAPFIVYTSIRRRRQEPASPALDAPPAE